MDEPFIGVLGARERGGVRRERLLGEFSGGRLISFRTG